MDTDAVETIPLSTQPTEVSAAPIPGDSDLNYKCQIEMLDGDGQPLLQKTLPAKIGILNTLIPILQNTLRQLNIPSFFTWSLLMS